MKIGLARLLKKRSSSMIGLLKAVHVRCTRPQKHIQVSIVLLCLSLKRKQSFCHVHLLGTCLSIPARFCLSHMTVGFFFWKTQKRQNCVGVPLSSTTVFFSIRFGKQLKGIDDGFCVGFQFPGKDPILRKQQNATLAEFL